MAFGCVRLKYIFCFGYDLFSACPELDSLPTGLLWMFMYVRRMFLERMLTGRLVRTKKRGRIFGSSGCQTCKRIHNDFSVPSHLETSLSRLKTMHKHVKRYHPAHFFLHVGYYLSNVVGLDVNHMATSKTPCHPRISVRDRDMPCRVIG